MYRFTRLELYSAETGSRNMAETAGMNFLTPTSYSTPIHYGVYLDSLCPFVDVTFNITPLYRGWDLATFVSV